MGVFKITPAPFQWGANFAKILHMEKVNTHYAKKIAKLRYKDEIIALHKQGMSLREIEQKINYKLARTRIKTTLSHSTISAIIKRYNNG